MRIDVPRESEIGLGSQCVKELVIWAMRPEMKLLGDMPDFQRTPVFLGYHVQ